MTQVPENICGKVHRLYYELTDPLPGDAAAEMRRSALVKFL